MSNLQYFDPDSPIVIGLAGEAGTGKTASASLLCPSVRMVDVNGNQITGDLSSNPANPPRYIWDHLWYSIPLYRIATARQQISGHRAHDRMCYEIHNALLDLWGGPMFGAPSYDDLVELVYDIVATPCDPEGKPRRFLQSVGTDLLRAIDDDVFVNWMRRRIGAAQREFVSEYEDTNAIHAIIVSDIRHKNEAALVREYQNSILVKLEASPEVRHQRLVERDGQGLDETSGRHRSENSISDIPEEWYSYRLNTDDLPLYEQAEIIRNYVERLTIHA